MTSSSGSPARALRDGRPTSTAAHYAQGAQPSQVTVSIYNVDDVERGLEPTSMSHLGYGYIADEFGIAIPSGLSGGRSVSPPCAKRDACEIKEDKETRNDQGSFA